jgi:hypothetical protein
LASVGIRWALGGAALAAGIGTTGVVVARRLSSTGSRDGSGLIAVGDPSIFEPNSAVEVHESDPPIWVVRSTGYDGLDTIYALRGRCPGGGSLASWSPETRTFECPGSADRYAISGLPLTGSGKRALERYRVALADDGRLVVDSTRTFREELGQWADSESFIRLSPEGSALR